MNAALLGMAIGLSHVFGVLPYLLIQLIALMVAGGAGCGCFMSSTSLKASIGTAAKTGSFVAAALKGSSFYKLPRVLQWFSGNIGFHHIHHLSPRIPNYNLEKCHRADPLFQAVKPVTFLSSFKSLTFRLWDEQGGRWWGSGTLRNWGNANRQPRMRLRCGSRQSKQAANAQRSRQVMRPLFKS